MDEEASGPSYSVPSLSNALANANLDIKLLHLYRGKKNCIKTPNIHLHSFSENNLLKKLGRSKKMKKYIDNLASEDFDIFHSHGLWMMPNIYPNNICRKLSKLHIIAPRGTLYPAALKFSKINKHFFWNFYQKKVLKEANAFHATSKDEAKYIRKLGFKQPIIICKNGIKVENSKKQFKQKNQNTLLYLGRLHEKKGLDMLLNIWSKIESQYPNWKLRIIGKGLSPYKLFLNERIRSLKISNVTLEKELYGKNKIDAFKKADLFILPTRGENFGMVIAEALANSLPVITTNKAPWNDLKKKECGISVDADEKELEKVLRYFLSLNQKDLYDMGLKGKSWMKNDYSWERVADEMINSYSWLLNGGKKPSNVV